jgi:DNA repair protein RecN (Recombination protein N)
LEESVTNDLKHVAMERAQFVVDVETATDQGQGESGAAERASDNVGRFFSVNGADQVRFLLSANPGEPARPIMRVASGGELSRVMLTLRSIGLQGKRAAILGETLVFDEIDTGISGRVAEAVGRRLKSLSKSRQVLCVTHQPQIARFADGHFTVDKFFEDERTIIKIKDLSSEERVEELARMIGGATGSTRTLEAARWLLESADLEKQQPSTRKKQKADSEKAWRPK